MDPVVAVSDGLLLGSIGSTPSGLQYSSFLGVPYAQPPIGDLRFKDPLPSKPWQGQRNAQKEGNICSQVDFFSPTQSYEGDEDCLFLNVYTPTVNISLELLLPVMVFIHGGGFSGGSGNGGLYGPQYLLEENVLVVTFNYRLGILGFLSLGTDEVPGNAGLKDMTMALKWINKNIKNFGGDPNNVTIFGESAGGAAVEFLTLSPKTEGLFQKAISQSGSCMNQWAHTRKQVDPKEKALELAKQISKNENLESNKVLDVLRKAPVKELVELVNKFSTPEEKLREAAFPFAPVAEVQNAEAFLTETCNEIYAKKPLRKISFLTGYNDNEGMVYWFNTQTNPDLFKIYENFEYFVPYDLGLEFGSKTSKEVAQKIKKFYTPDKLLGMDNLEPYFNILTDLSFLYQITRSMNYSANARPHYFYRLAFDGDLNAYKKLINIPEKGTCHGDDLGYIFNITQPPFTTTPGSKSDITRKRIVKMWTNFAKHGDPVTKVDDLTTVKWEKVDPIKSMKLLRIEETMKMDDMPECPRIEFWNNIYKEYQKN